MVLRSCYYFVEYKLMSYFLFQVSGCWNAWLTAKSAKISRKVRKILSQNFARFAVKLCSKLGNLKQMKPETKQI